MRDRLREADFEKIADLLHETLDLCKATQAKHGKLLKDFNKCAPVSWRCSPYVCWSCWPDFICSKPHTAHGS